MIAHIMYYLATTTALNEVSNDMPFTVDKDFYNINTLPILLFYMVVFSTFIVQLGADPRITSRRAGKNNASFIRV